MTALTHDPIVDPPLQFDESLTWPTRGPTRIASWTRARLTRPFRNRTRRERRPHRHDHDHRSQHVAPVVPRLML